MILVAWCAGMGSPPSASATSAGEALDGRNPTDEDVPKRLRTGGRIIEIGHRIRDRVVGVLSHGVDESHGLLATVGGRHRGLSAVLLEVPLGQRLVVATLAGVQDPGRGPAATSSVSGSSPSCDMRSFRCHGDNQGAVVVAGDLHASSSVVNQRHMAPADLPYPVRSPPCPRWPAGGYKRPS